MSRPHNIPAIFRAASPLALLAACTSDVVDLGSDGLTQSLESSTLCAQSPSVRGPIEVQNQEQLEALSGCEEVRGDLHIRIYEGTDLRPLSSLRSVLGRFTLGNSLDSDDDAATWEAEEAIREQIVEAGWLTSLEGLESLERVGSLEIERIAAPDLRPLSNLRNLAGNDDPEYAGWLSIRRARALVNLVGLENAGGVADVFIDGNAALESLFGLQLSEVVPGFVSLNGNPRLTDIFALAPLEAVDYLFIEGCGVADLDALAGLQYARTLNVRDNAELLDTFGIGGASFEQLSIEANPKLASIPTFPNQRGNLRLTVADNQVLSTLELAYPPGDFYEQVGERSFYFGSDWIEIHDNPSLASIAIADNPFVDPAYDIFAAQVFAAYRNPALSFIDLGNLQRLDLLSISDNPALTTLVSDQLERVDEIAVTNNPQLATAALRAVPTFAATFSGNADDASVPTEPASAPGEAPADDPSAP